MEALIWPPDAYLSSHNSPSEPFVRTLFALAVIAAHVTPASVVAQSSQVVIEVFRDVDVRTSEKNADGTVRQLRGVLYANARFA